MHSTKYPVVNQQLLNWYPFEPNSSCLHLDKENEPITELLLKKCKEVVVSDIDSQKIKSKKFDYIVSVYGGLKISNEKLKKIKAHLSKKGVLIVGVENRIGISSWNSTNWRENSQSLNNIQYDRYQQSSAMTKKEIKTVMSKLKFSSVRMYYPLPNLSSPSEVYSDEYLPNNDRLLSPHSSGFGYDKGQVFSNTLAFKTIIKSGDFSTFANSFLIIAKVSK